MVGLMPAQQRKGNREGQLRYYLAAAKRERWGRKWNRFWSARWFWSAGRIGPLPQGYGADYWTPEQQPCPECLGYGWTTTAYDHMPSDRTACEACRGTGHAVAMTGLEKPHA